MTDGELSDRFWRSKAGDYGDLIAYGIWGKHIRFLFEEATFTLSETNIMMNGNVMPTKDVFVTQMDSWKNVASEGYDEINPEYKEEFLSAMI